MEKENARPDKIAEPSAQVTPDSTKQLATLQAQFAIIGLRLTHRRHADGEVLMLKQGDSCREFAILAAARSYFLQLGSA